MLYSFVPKIKTYYMRSISFSILITLLLIATTGCKKQKVNDLKSDFKANYAAIVYANYQDAYTDAVALQTAIYTFVDAPSESGLTSAKTAWLSARESYGQTEAFRF